MLPRTILLRQKKQLTSLVQLRHNSTKVPRLGSVKLNSTKGLKTPDATQSTNAPLNLGGGSTGANSAQQALLRSRKTNNAKAKAQASASRALREQVAAAAITKSGVDTIVIEEAQERQQLEKDASSSSTMLPLDSPLLPIRRLHDAVAFATAESYNFERLISSGRLPRGWQLLEDDEVIHVPQWPQSHSSSSSTITTTAGLLPTSSSASSSNSSSQGEAFIFRSGSYVTWGMTNDQSRKFLRMVIQGRALDGLSAEVDGYDEIGDEAMEYLVADDQ
jgi:uncharacterized Rmd1/YagE family protein